MTPKAGETFAVSFPFCLEEIDLWPGDDPEATAPATVKSWRPGIRWEQDNNGDADACADAVGQMLLTVVDVHKPGRYPTRVFYTRQWVDPTGKVFGKANLRMTTLEAFRRRAKGYMRGVWIDGGEVLLSSQKNEASA